MIDENKIAKTATLYAKETWNHEEEQFAAMCAFKEGTLWAQQEFIKSLWHDASEEPEGGDIVVQIISRINNKPYYEVTQNSLIYEWEYMVKCNGITKWAYLDDILPKEGGEK